MRRGWSGSKRTNRAKTTQSLLPLWMERIPGKQAACNPRSSKSTTHTNTSNARPVMQEHNGDREMHHQDSHRSPQADYQSLDELTDTEELDVCEHKFARLRLLMPPALKDVDRVEWERVTSEYEARVAIALLPSPVIRSQLPLTSETAAVSEILTNKG